MSEDYITLREAREFLGISKNKIAKMVKDGTVKTIPDPLDSRVKLVKKVDIERLKLRSKA